MAQKHRRMKRLEQFAANHRGLTFADFCAAWPNTPGEDARKEWNALVNTDRQAALAAAPAWLAAAKVARPGCTSRALAYLRDRLWRHLIPNGSTP